MNNQENLSARKVGRINVLFFILGIISIFTSCDDPSLVGNDFVGSEPLSITYYDTLSIKISTVKYDSIVTSSSSRMIIGHSEDDYLGNITAQSFFQVGRDSLSTFPDEEKATYDSIALELIFYPYSYYDTTSVQTFSFYSLISEMELDDDGYLYNTSSVSFQPDTAYFLGKHTFKPKVRNGDPEYLHISDEFGRALFNLLINEDDIVTSTDTFLEYIKGFALIPDSTNTCILSLTNETNIKLFYTQEGEQVEQKFPVANNTHFSKIYRENQLAAFEKLTQLKDILPSEETENISFIQGGIGLGIRLEFPYLDHVRELSKSLLVSDAEVILSPVRGSYSGMRPLVSDLNAYVVDERNNILGEIDIDATLYYDDEYNEDTYYVINIQSFLETQLNLLEDNGNAILLSLPNNSESVSRLYIGNQSNKSRSFMRLLVMNANNVF